MIFPLDFYQFKLSLWLNLLTAPVNIKIIPAKTIRSVIPRYERIFLSSVKIEIFIDNFGANEKVWVAEKNLNQIFNIRRQSLLFVSQQCKRFDTCFASPLNEQTLQVRAFCFSFVLYFPAWQVGLAIFQIMCKQIWKLFLLQIIRSASWLKQSNKCFCDSITEEKEWEVKHNSSIKTNIHVHYRSFKGDLNMESEQ